MPPKIDLADRRRAWLEFFSEFDSGSHPERAHPRMWGSFTNNKATTYADAYLLGFSAEVRPRVAALLAWMERQPEPDQRHFLVRTIFPWSYAVYQWRQALGLCKWLSRGDSAEADFAGAVAAEWQAWEKLTPTPKEAAIARGMLRLNLGEYLATAVAGNVPALGLKLYEASGIKRASGRDGPARGIGEWACRHLANGGVRDAAFTSRGARMLMKVFASRYEWHGLGVDAALWLKAIYFDSGVVQTPEQAIAKAYESLPGVTPPASPSG